MRGSDRRKVRCGLHLGAPEKGISGKVNLNTEVYSCGCRHLGRVDLQERSSF